MNSIRFVPPPQAELVAAPGGAEIYVIDGLPTAAGGARFLTARAPYGSLSSFHSPITNHR